MPRRRRARVNGSTAGSPSRARAPHGQRPACYRCFKPKATCICASIEIVDNKTGVIVLQHPHERFHPIGTARIAQLGLARVRVEPCTPWADHSAIAARFPDRTALLYPAADARDLCSIAVDERPHHLVVIDGTWFHAKKIYDAHPWLGALPHVSLAPPMPSLFRGVRRQPKAPFGAHAAVLCISTLEAIVQALGILEPETTGLDRLLTSFSAMVERQASRTPGRALARTIVCPPMP